MQGGPSSLALRPRGWSLAIAICLVLGPGLATCLESKYSLKCDTPACTATRRITAAAGNSIDIDVETIDLDSGTESIELIVSSRSRGLCAIGAGNACGRFTTCVRGFTVQPGDLVSGTVEIRLRASRDVSNDCSGLAVNAVLTLRTTPTPTPTPTITRLRTKTTIPTMSVTVTPTMTPTATATATDTPTHTNTQTPTRSGTRTPTWTNTGTPTYSQTATQTQSSTPSPTPTPTASTTSTTTSTPTPSRTPTTVPTNTRTPTGTRTPTATSSPRQCSPGTCRNGTCSPGDSLPCICHTNAQQGFWDGPTCDRCATNYYGPQCRQFCSTDSSCSGHGTCTQEGKCNCFPPALGSWAGDDCSVCAKDFYGGNCNVFCKSNSTCSSHGTCNNDGSCLCSNPDASGGRWSGANCNRCANTFIGPNCDVLCDDKADCNGQGTCSSVENGRIVCICNDDDQNGHWNPVSRCATCLPGYSLLDQCRIFTGPQPSAPSAPSPPTPNPVSTAADTPEETDNSGIIGAVVGAVVGLILLLAVGAAAFAFFVFRSTREGEEDDFDSIEGNNRSVEESPPVPINEYNNRF